MARIKLAYIGGGSTRGAGTMASFIHNNGAEFDGSRGGAGRPRRRPARADPDARREDGARPRRRPHDHGHHRPQGCASSDCDAVLSSFRPGGFSARAKDERIPLNHGVIGQETQGPGGFFMALRAIAILKDICAEMEEVCPDAWLFNYTNPVNLVAEAVTHHSEIKCVSLCEGPIYFVDQMAGYAQLDPEKLSATMVGLNHGCWSVEHTYDGEDAIPHIEAAWERRRDDPELSTMGRRILHLGASMGSIPAEYFMYYYFRDEIVSELAAKPTTRAEDIMGWAPDYWRHYEEQAKTDDPQLDPGRSRGGIHELELAIDVMDAIFNDKDEVHPVNVPNAGGALPGLPGGPRRRDPRALQPGRHPAAHLGAAARHVRGLVEMLGEYQAVAAEAAWSGGRRDAVRALAANPLVMRLDLAEQLYDELLAAHRDLLPDRLAA